MPDTSMDPFERQVVATFARRFDLEIHVAKITVEELPYVDVREYVPSLGQYGRGILLPKHMAVEISSAIAEAVSDD